MVGGKHLFGLKTHCGSRGGKGNGGYMRACGLVTHVFRGPWPVSSFECPLWKCMNYYEHVCGQYAPEGVRRAVGM